MVHANCVKIGLHIHQIVAVEPDAAVAAVSAADADYDVVVDAAVVAAGGGDDEQGLQVPWDGDHGCSVLAWTAQLACLSPGPWRH